MNQVVVVVFVVVVLVCRVPSVNAPGYTAACRLIINPYSLDFPTHTARYLSHYNDTRSRSSERWKYWARKCREILAESGELHAFIRDLLYASNLRHGTDGFTSPSKVVVQRIFFALENPTASAGSKPTKLCTKGQHPPSRPLKPLYYARK